MTDLPSRLRGQVPREQLEAIDAELTLADDDHVAPVNSNAIRMSFIWTAPTIGHGVSYVPIGVGGGGDTKAIEVVFPWDVYVVGLSVRLGVGCTFGWAEFHASFWGGTYIGVFVKIDTSVPLQASKSWTKADGLILEAGWPLGCMLASDSIYNEPNASAVATIVVEV
jgi:hypothetical protein